MKILHVNYSDIIGGAAIATYQLHKNLLSKNITSKMLVNKKTSMMSILLVPQTNLYLLKQSKNERIKIY